MKRNSIYKFLIPFTLLISLGLYSLKDGNPKKPKIILNIIKTALEQLHYSPKQIDNELSENVYKTYLERLDYNKWFFLQSDIDNFNQYKYKIDDEVKAETFEFFNLTKETYLKRVSESEKFLSKIMKKPFDFTIDEEIDFEPDNRNYCKSKKELKDFWRRYYKSKVLRKLNNKLLRQEKAKEKNDTTVKQKTFKELEAESRKEVLKTYTDWYHRMHKITENDILGFYLNSIVTYFDPHSQYYAPKDKDNFDISISGKLEGIGAQLSQPNAYIKIMKIVPGSPSWKQGELEEGDLIIEVAQKGKDPVNVVDMPLDEAIKMIRGKKGTTVILTVKKQNGDIVKIPIVRDVIELEATFARSFIINDGNEKIGYINLPMFYVDFKDNKGRTSAEDIKKELEKLNKEGVDKLILDLRNNGGGSLRDAIKIAGYFIEKGPIVQVRSRNKKPYVMKDPNHSKLFKGKVIVMVNKNSASASEITAAALQDYNRALIVGTENTFGKGTVQRFISFDDVIKDKSLKPLGALKVTIQKFYRINGGATQIKGVVPDIILPSAYDGLLEGEKGLDYPIPWDEIVRADYQEQSNMFDKNFINIFNQKYVKNDTVYQAIRKYNKYLTAQKNDTKQNLNLKKFQEEEKEAKKVYDKYKASTKIKTPYTFHMLKTDSIAIGNDTIKLTHYKSGIKRMKKDLYLNKTIKLFSNQK